MNINRKEEIIMATLELASQNGLGCVSTNMIAEKVGIKKPSLYNHFSSKDEIVQEMYSFLRAKAVKNTKVSIIDYQKLIKGKSAFEVLLEMVNNYDSLNHDKNMLMFYKVIYSERSINPIAAQIMTEETDRMITATKQLFLILQENELLYFKDVQMSALAFAMTIHGLIEYKIDYIYGTGDSNAREKDKLIQEYVKWFCTENKMENSN